MRKRHLPVDTLSLPLLVNVHSAGTQDRDGDQVVFASLANRFAKLRKTWADAFRRSQGKSPKNASNLEIG